MASDAASKTRGPPGPLFINRSSPNAAAVLRHQISTDLRRQQQQKANASIAGSSNKFSNA